MDKLFFEPSARLQRFLGRELIADPNVAVAEFVKNGYDAGASIVHVDFKLEGPDRSEHTLAITDDGVGMDLASFERNWMRPGYSEKAAYAPGVDHSRWTEPAAGRAEKRVPIGEKGVGRLAAGRLGERVSVYTRVSEADRWLKVDFVWADFDTMNRVINQIPIGFEHVDEPAVEVPKTGTVVVISDLSIDWRGRLPGRKINGRSDFRLGRLKEDLSVLVLPIAKFEDDEFAVWLRSSGVGERDEDGILEAGEPDWDAYRLDFELRSTDDGGVEVTRLLRRSKDVADQVHKPPVEQSDPERIQSGSRPGFEDDYRPSDLKCGAFSGYFLYTTVPWKRRGRGYTIPPGVLLYRDHVRVPPYGDVDDDWLNVKSRKASRQGYALQPESLWGRVEITKGVNSALTDMSNRQGLVINDAYEDFLRHARAEYRKFAELVESEWLTEQWLAPEIRTQRGAETLQAHQRAMAHMYVHRLRGPLGAVRVDIQASLNLLGRLGDEPIAGRLAKYLNRADDRLDELDESLAELLEMSIEEPPEPSEFDLRDAIKQGIESAAGAVQSRDITLTTTLRTRRLVVLPFAIVVEAVAGLITNAAEVQRPSERQPGHIEVSIADGPLGHRVAVSDDGVGMTGEEVQSLFNEARTKKGTAGMGLINTRTLLRLYGADVMMDRTDDGGSRFHLELPSVGLDRKKQL